MFPFVPENVRDAARNNAEQALDFHKRVVDFQMGQYKVAEDMMTASMKATKTTVEAMNAFARSQADVMVAMMGQAEA